MKNVLAIAFSALVLATPGKVMATTITFNALEQAGGGFIDSGAAYTENGFQLSGGDLVTAQQNNVEWYFGSASMFQNVPNGTTTLTAIGGGPFSLNSIDLAPVSTVYPSGASVTFTGNIHGGGTITETFIAPTTYTFATYDFTGFANLDSVTWTQAFPYTQADNLVVDAVPEPASLMLVGTGVLTFVARRRRRKSTSA